jgi:hypothetical protein
MAEYGSAAPAVDFIEKNTKWKRLSDGEIFEGKGISLPIGADYEDVSTGAVFTWNGTNAFRRSGYEGSK